jgi:rare lipoprotein A
MKRLMIQTAAAMAAMTLSVSAAQAGWRDGIFNHNTTGSLSASAPAAQQKPAPAPKPSTAAAKPAPKAAQSAPKRQSNAQKPQRRASSGRVLRGLASYYWQPQRVASGGWFNPNALTAAHKTLPFGTRVRVTNLRNGRSVIVRINDRGPYIRGRIIDLSKRAAGVIAMQGAGVVPVSVEVL